MNSLTYLILITVITTSCMYVCDCTIWGFYPMGVPAFADCPIQNLKSWRNKIPSGEPYKILHYLLYRETAPITVGRLWKLQRVSENCESERMHIEESV